MWVIGSSQQPGFHESLDDLARRRRADPEAAGDSEIPSPSFAWMRSVELYAWDIVIGVSTNSGACEAAIRCIISSKLDQDLGDERVPIVRGVVVRSHLILRRTRNVRQNRLYREAGDARNRAGDRGC